MQLSSFRHAASSSTRSATALTRSRALSTLGTRQSTARSCYNARTTPRRTIHTGSTVNADEIAHFSRLSSLWWDEQGEFSLLHRMNPVRMQFIRQKLLEIERDDADDDDGTDRWDILAGKSVLDVGCGGGLLSEVRSRYPERMTLHFYFYAVHAK